MGDLSEDDLCDLDVRYGDKTPKRRCRVCGDVDWSLQGFGRGCTTWACRNSLAEHHGGHAGNKQDWEHYRKSSHDVVSGDDRVTAMLAEIRRHRAMVKRLEAWAVELDAKRDQPGDVGHFIAAELRNRMKEPSHG